MLRIVRSLVLVALVLATACTAPSAARRVAPRLRDAWDVSEHGGSVAWRGPVLSGVALGDFLFHAIVPIHTDGYFLVDGREPREKWFRAYAGPMRPIDEVALLCHRDRTTSIYSIRAVSGETAYAARHQPWHYPRCVEVLNGAYQLEVNYYSRSSVDVNRDFATHTVESARPSVVEWEAEAGAIYQLRAVLGAPEDAPGDDPKFFNAPPRSSSPGTTTYDLQVSTWNARIERLPSPAYLDDPVRELRERWRQYEELRR